MWSTTSSKISESSLNFEGKNMKQKEKGAFKDSSQINSFAISFTMKITIFGNTGATLKCEKVCILSATNIKDYW